MAFSAKSALRAACLAALALSLSGCAEMLGMESKQLTRAEAALAARIDTLQARVDSLQNELAKAARRNQADLAALQRAVQEGNDAIAARIEENTYAISRSAAKPAPAAQPEGKKKAQTPAQAAAPAASPAPAGEELEKLYNMARADFNAQRFQEAYQGFKSVYEQAPEGRRAEDALYWMGLCFEKTSQPDAALVVYRQVLDAFPQGKKSCAARFQMARIAEAQGRADERLELLRQLAGEPVCASSNEGRRAAEMLK